MYIVSACLLGENCKYNGGNNRCDNIIEFTKNHNCVSVCPEILGGLPAPRPPVELINEKAINNLGYDVTFEFERGISEAWRKICDARNTFDEEIEGAILKAKSPTCGCMEIYDGSFSHKVIVGDGMFAEFLKQKGIQVKNEEDMKND